MSISLVTHRLPESCLPSISTITMCEACSKYLLQPVGVTRIRSGSSRAERFPEVPGAKPSRFIHLPNRTNCLRRSPSEGFASVIGPTLLPPSDGWSLGLRPRYILSHYFQCLKSNATGAYRRLWIYRKSRDVDKVLAPSDIQPCNLVEGPRCQHS